MSVGYFRKRLHVDSTSYLPPGGADPVHIKFTDKYSLLNISAGFIRYLAGGTRYDTRFGFYLGAGVGVVLRQLRTDYQTAPVPYISNADGPWYTPETWKNNDVQDLPYALSIVDGSSRVAWNIVQINHNIQSTGNKIVLGMDIASAKKLTANNDTKIEV